MPFTFDLRRGGIAPFLREVYDTLLISQSGGYALQPGQFALGQTLERVTLRIREGRPCLAARIEGRSSFARCGLIIHFTAPTIHAGFNGTITLEMKNLGDHPITLYPGLRIAQLVVEQVLGTPFRRSSQFDGQELPTGPAAQTTLASFTRIDHWSHLAYPLVRYWVPAQGLEAGGFRWLKTTYRASWRGSVRRTSASNASAVEA